MSFLIDGVVPEKHRAEGYFCASNTGSGFQNYFPDVFSDLSRLYIIKGGPGTGKSTLMKKIAAEAKNRSLKTELFFCSSDTDSLDGVIVDAPGGVFGVIDGTSPHVWEPKCPGALQQSVDLSQFWDEKLLESASGEIRLLNAEISARYRKVYLDLAAVSRVRALCREYVRPWVLFDKMDAWIKRFVAAVPGDGMGRENVRLRRGFGVHGGVCLDEFVDSAGKKILISSHYPAISGLLLERLQDALIGAGAAFDVSYAPVTSETDGIRLRDPDVVLIPYSGENPGADGAVRILHTERFLDPGIKKEKQRLKTLLSAGGELSEIAAYELSQIGKLHDHLEEYYIRAMDREKLDLFTKKLLIRLFCK